VTDRSAVVFPGQGSQSPQMRRTVERHAPDLHERAVELVGDDPLDRADEGTQWAQPAIYCASIAGWRAAGIDDGVAAFAGHSLGEVAARVAAGAVEVDDGLRLVCLRGRLMQRSAAAETGGMMALVGPAVPHAEGLVERSGAALVNDNGAQQIVVAGDEDSLATLARLAAAADGLKALRLPVAGAFHTPALRPEVAALREAMLDVEIRPPSAPVLSSMRAAPFTDVRAQLPEAMGHPVRWRDTVEQLLAMGVTCFVDVGPGKVLARLVTRDHGRRAAVRSIEVEEETHVA